MDGVATAESPARPEQPPRRDPWYRKVWIVGLAGAVLGLAIGAGIAVGTSKQTELEAARNEIEQLTEQLETVQQANDDLTTQNATLEIESGSSENRIADLEAQVARLTEKLEKKQAPPPSPTPNAGVFEVDYSEWSGLFKITGLTLKYDFGWEVLGQIEYLGGGDCPLGYVEVEATYFDGNLIVDSDFTNFTSLPQGTPRVLEIFGPERKPTRVLVTVAEASCE